MRLPGVANDISRKLGFEIIEEPYLLPDQEKQLLHAGYQGDIVLKGGRLWRSTEATLGSQKANRITVLPDMEGIIAHFDCVEPQAGWDIPAYIPAPSSTLSAVGRPPTAIPQSGIVADIPLASFSIPLIVWTSEGEARLLNPDDVKVEVPPWFQRMVAAHKYPCPVKTAASAQAAQEPTPTQAPPSLNAPDQASADQPDQQRFSASPGRSAERKKGSPR